MTPTTASPSVSFTSAHITLAPSAAKIFAVEAPMPDAAPVTMATLSFRRMGFLRLWAGAAVREIGSRQVWHGRRAEGNAAILPKVGNRRGPVWLIRQFRCRPSLRDEA